MVKAFQPVTSGASARFFPLSPPTAMPWNKMSATASAPLPREQREAMQAAQEFEAIFVHYLLKAMRESVPQVGMFPRSFASDVYEQMFDENLSRHVARGKGLGLAEMVYREWVHLEERPPGKEKAALSPIGSIQ